MRSAKWWCVHNAFRIPAATTEVEVYEPLDTAPTRILPALRTSAPRTMTLPSLSEHDFCSLPPLDSPRVDLSEDADFQAFDRRGRASRRALPIFVRVAAPVPRWWWVLWLTTCMMVGLAIALSVASWR